MAEIGVLARDKKEIVVNDRDGKIISYKVGRRVLSLGEAEQVAMHSMGWA